MYLIQPFYENGDLEKWSQRLHDRNEWSEALTRRVARQLLMAVEHLHSYGVIHCDIKPGNVFITTELNVKLGDFDVSMSSEERPNALFQFAQTTKLNPGTVLYAAPEIEDQRATLAADIFSYGLVRVYANVADFEGNALA